MIGKDAASQFFSLVSLVQKFRSSDISIRILKPAREQQFFLGCAVWSYRDWLGDLFPVGSQSRDFLALYSRRLTTVEGNTTFYAVPNAATLQRWAEQTPASFQFCLKLPRSITHTGRLQDAIASVIAFLDHTEILTSRRGPLFAQLPPSYSPSQFDDLAAFLKAWPRDRADLAVELRHLDWFRSPHCDRVNELLQELQLGRVLLDTRPIYQSNDDPQRLSQRRKPKVPLQPITTASYGFVRYISHPDLAQNQAYLQAWVAQVDQWLRQGKTVYFFVHCPQEVRSPALARQFQTLLEQHDAPVPPLPWNQIADESAPAQLSLF
jgi:uncharacterized protein YecE (DUF72 family)